MLKLTQLSGSKVAGCTARHNYARNCDLSLPLVLCSSTRLSCRHTSEWRVYRLPALCNPLLDPSYYKRNGKCTLNLTIWRHHPPTCRKSMSLKKRSRSEAESSDAVSDDEREVEDTEEEEYDQSSDFDPDMVCLVSNCAWTGFSMFPRATSINSWPMFLWHQESPHVMFPYLPAATVKVSNSTQMCLDNATYTIHLHGHLYMCTVEPPWSGRCSDALA